MKISQIEFNNFRIYKGYHKIVLNAPEEGNIVIISGKNGFGKTTFLMSLVWCLYGRQMAEVDEPYKQEIKKAGGYSKYISNSLNRLAKVEGDTSFSVSLTITDIEIPDLPCNKITISRSFDVETGASDTLNILVDGHENELTKGEEQAELFIRDFIMPKEIAKFFFFDAEKIVSLAEITTAEQRRALSLSYSEVLGIKKYEDLKASLEELQVRLRSESASKDEREALNNLEAEIKNHEIIIADNQERIRELEEERDRMTYEVNLLQEKLIREGNIITIEELEELKTKEVNLVHRLDELSNQIKASFDLIPFAIAGGKLFEVVNQVASELAYKRNKYKVDNVNDVTNAIIDDIINEPKPEGLLIQHQVEDYYKGLIRQVIKKHFFEDVDEIDEEFQPLHDFSDQKLNELQALTSNLKISFKEKFSRITGDVNQLRNERDAIRRKIRGAEADQEDPIIADVREKKEDFERMVLEKGELIGRLKEESDRLKLEITHKEKAKKEIAKKLTASKKNKKKDKETSILISELGAFIIEFKKQKKALLEEEILEGLKMLMHKQNFIHRAEVEIIGEDIDIHLYNVRDERIRKESLSKGEQQMYATALLRGLVEGSAIEFPVFIDSPMQKFDDEHARNIIKHFYPNISKQVVLFPLINKEMNEEEYELILPKVARSYLIHNVSDDESGFVEISPTKLFEEHNRKYNAN